MVDNIVTYLNSTSIESNTKLYNNQKYQIDIIFDNLQGNTFKLNLASMVSLEIEEDTRMWFKKAALTINNPKNVFEQKINSSASPNLYYKFRNDGRDLVYVIVKPIADDSITNTGLQLDYDVWGMAYTFCIYDRKEIPGENTNQKQLKLFLWEFDYQILAETNLAWSTTELLTNINPAYATDEQKLVKTGDAIKSLINKALYNYSTPVYSKYWDSGSSKIFFTAFAKHTASDVLEYLLKKHVSSETNDPALIARTRYTRQWALRSYASLFGDATDQKGNAGRLQREIFTLAGQGGDKQDEYVFDIQSPVLGYSTQYPNTNYQDPVRSVLTNMHITDMAALDNMYEMISSPCYSNDLKYKQFNLEININNIENVKKYVTDTYSKKLQSYSPVDTLITLNKLKTDALAVNNVYSLGRDATSRLAEGRNFLLTSALFLNSALSFNAVGSVIREAGTFITLDASNGGVVDEFANKTMGQWLVYKVVHRFTETDYNNEIMAVRLHANANIDIKSTIT